MKIKVAVVTREIDLSEYNEAMSGGIVQVWVNPPRSVRREREDLLRTYADLFRSVAVSETSDLKKYRLGRLLDFFRGKHSRRSELEKTERRVYAWFATLWSQGPNPELHWTADEVAEVNERDPALYAWLIRKSVLMIDAWQADKKKE